MIKPTVSVIMPVHNAARYLREAIQSILNQTYSDFELICLDDASSDDSLSILRSIQDPRLRIMVHATNAGIAVSLNELISVAEGRYIARMDADDINLPDRLQLQVDYLDKHPDAAAVFTFVELIDHYGAAIGYWPEDRTAVTPSQIRKTCPRTNCLAHPTAMIRSAEYRSRSYRSSLEGSEDWGLWLEMLSDGLALHKIAEPLVRYRVHVSSITVRSNAANRGYRKIKRFRAVSLREQKQAGRWSTIERQVAWYGLVDRWWTPVWRSVKRIANSAGKIIQANPFRLSWELVRLWLQLDSIRRPGPIFFFPFNHIGGAEHVHSELVEAVGSPTSLVFITKISQKNGVSGAYAGTSTVIDIGRLCTYPVFRDLTRLVLLRFFRRVPDTVMFGSNSEFFYNMIDSIPERHRLIDLIHAFMDRTETGSEHWSLPVAHRFDRRVFVSTRAMHQMEELYRRHGLDPVLAERFLHIPNATAVPPVLVPKPDELFTVVYLGRGTPEKRVFLVGKLATALRKSHPAIRFLLVGDLYGAVLPEDRQACDFAGVVNTPDSMRSILEDAHVVVLTSSREGMPLAIMEGMAHGLVPVTTGVGDLPEVLENGIDSIVVDPEDADQVVSGMMRSISELYADRRRLNRMSAAAHDKAQQLFNRERFAASYRSLLQAQQ